MPRSFFAVGVGKSPEQAVARMYLKAEGIKQGVEAACFILDFDNCCEHLDRSMVQRAAAQHGFTLAVARLCIHMYRAWRTVAWRFCFAMLAKSSQTLVLGCSIAMWLLQLILITPLGEYFVTLPIQASTPEVYVDDATVMITGKAGKGP